MPSRNTLELEHFIANMEVGETAEVQTSEYATNHTRPGYRFDFWSTAAAVRGAAARGLIEADYKWLYYEIKKL